MNRMSILTLVVLVIGLVVLIILRKSYIILKETKPKSAKASNKTSRIAEAVILLCAATTTLIFTATNTSTGGRLLILDQLNPGFATINIIIAFIAMAGLLAGLVVTLLGRTSIGTLIAAIFIISYGIFLNNHSDFLETLAPGGSATPKIPYLLRLSRSPVVGAELWVNGVFLGNTTVETTVEEFLEKVPYWPEPPEGYRDKTDEMHIPHYSPKGGNGYRIYQRWARLELPEGPREAGRSIKGKYYYARVKLDGQWGYFEGGGGGGGGGGKYTYSAERHFPAVFPQLQERIDKMLDKARLSDYRVGTDWFKAMETFDQVGLIAIYKAMEREPDMMKVIDDWAAWKYELDKITDAKSAWRVFEKICDEANQLQSYSTISITGRAVELIINQIDAERLIDKAIGLIRSTRSYGWNSWVLNGRLQFGMTYRPEGFATGSDAVIGSWRGGRGNRLPVSGYAVAHAIWMLDVLLDFQDDSQPNIIERKVVPNLLCWHSNWTESIRLAACLGGEDIERFLDRHNWRADSQELPFRQQLRLSGQEVNTWLYLLANLDSPMGREFRSENKRLLMDLADRIEVRGIEDYGLLGQNPFGFLFIDKNLALEYWPRFKIRTISKSQGYDALKQQFYYLVNMESASTVEMYLSAWRGYSKDYSFFQEALSVLENLSEEKYEQVIKAIEQSIKEDVSHIEGFPGDEAGVRNYLLRHIKDENWSADRKARDIIENLIARTEEYKHQGVSDWLEHAEPDHPLIDMLVDADEPELRLLVMGELREYPTPANRAILRKLLKDSNEQVRKAAKEVAAELAQLKKITSAQFVAGSNQMEAQK